MTPPRKRGRKPTAEHRDNRFSVGYTDAETELVTRAADHKSLDLATWIRMVTVEAARTDAESRESK